MPGKDLPVGANLDGCRADPRTTTAKNRMRSLFSCSCPLQVTEECSFRIGRPSVSAGERLPAPAVLPTFTKVKFLAQNTKFT
jgi:hypothetical protein